LLGLDLANRFFFLDHSPDVQPSEDRQSGRRSQAQRAALGELRSGPRSRDAHEAGEHVRHCSVA
jgi:hypothetical protein